MKIDNSVKGITLVHFKNMYIKMFKIPVSGKSWPDDTYIENEFSKVLFIYIHNDLTFYVIKRIKMNVTEDNITDLINQHASELLNRIIP